MAIFNSYVSHYQRVIPFFTCWQYPSICWRQSRNKCRWNPYSSPMNLHVLRNKRPKKQVLSWHLQNSTLLNLNFISKKQKKQSFPSTLPRNLHGFLNFASNFPYEIPMVSPLPRRFSASFHKRKPSAAPTEPRPAWDCQQGTHIWWITGDISGDIDWQ